MLWKCNQFYLLMLGFYGVNRCMACMVEYRRHNNSDILFGHFELQNKTKNICMNCILVKRNGIRCVVQPVQKKNPRVVSKVGRVMEIKYYTLTIYR